MSEKGRMLTTMTDIWHCAGRVTRFLVLTSVLAVAVAGPASAARTTSKEVVDCYNKAQKLMSQEPPKNGEALRIINKCLEGNRSKDELAVLLRFRATIEVELDKYRAAIRDIEASFKTGKLTPVEKAENYFFLGRLYLGIDPPNYNKAIENLREFLKVAKNPDPDAYFYLGQALALTGKYHDALRYAQKAVELDKSPKEAHYRLELYCYSELEDYKHLIPLARLMLNRFGPKDLYLSQLAAAYQAVGRDEDAFHFQAYRYQLGYLHTEGELVGIAQMYLEYENPDRAARILDKEMRAGRVKRTEKNLERLGNMWFLAREYDKARTNFLAAATMSKDGKLNFRIAQTYFEDEKWSQAESHFRKALAKGGLKEPCQARLMLAHTLDNEKNDVAALKEFKEAAKSKACAVAAQQWVTYLIDRERVYKNAKARQFMDAVSTELQKAQYAIPDNEDVEAVAKEAKTAAQAALDAKTPQVRGKKLSEYERARDSAMRRLNAGALDDARKDRISADKAVKDARTLKDLGDINKNLVDQLEKSSKHRVEVLEKAEAELKKAKALADKARAK